MKNRIKGFTLIELLVAVAIIGILATTLLVILDPGKRIAQSKDSVVKSDLSIISKALESYSASQGIPKYTASLGDLVTANELKSVPTQQAGNKACLTANSGSTLVTSGTAGQKDYYYCYYTATSGGIISSAAVMGTLFSFSSDTWQCWDSTTGKFKTSTTAPSVTSGNLTCN